jgi:hypothetical protein
LPFKLAFHLKRDNERGLTLNYPGLRLTGFI